MNKPTILPALPFLVPLDRAALDLWDIPAPWRYGKADRVRYEDLDNQNHVNNTRYLRWWEAQRVEYMTDHGIAAFAPGGPGFVVKRQEIDYLRPMLLNEIYVTVARVSSFRRTSFVMDYAVFAPDCCATGSALVVRVDGNGAKAPLDPELTRLFVETDGAEAL